MEIQYTCMSLNNKETHQNSEYDMLYEYTREDGMLKSSWYQGKVLEVV